MENRTYYFPRNQVSRRVLNFLITNAQCSVGKIRPVAGLLAVSITVPKRNITRVEHILQIYNLL